jgi:HK97 family phage portal protein
MEPSPVEIAPGRGDLNWTSTALDASLLASTAHLTMIGKTVSYAKLFQTQPLIASAVMRLLTWAIRVPLKVYRRTGDDSRIRLRPSDHPLAAAIITPWERGHQAGLIQALLGPLFVHGNSVAEIEQGARNRIQFIPHDWRFSKPIMPFRDSIEGFRVNTDHRDFVREVSIDEILHLAWWSPMGPLGTSPLMQLGTTLNIEDAAQRYQQSTFRNGARPPSAVTSSEQFLTLEREEREELMLQLRTDLMAIYAGPENAGRPALLPPGLDWKPVGHTAVEAALIEQRKVAAIEVCGVYMIPPPMLGILDRATFSNITELREMTYTESVGPPLVLAEQVLNAQLVRALLREDDVYCEFDFGGVLRGDRLKEIDALRNAVASALYTPNEGREKLNMPRSDQTEMDQFYLPVNNLAPVGSTPTPRRISMPGNNDQPGQGPRLEVRSREGNYEIVFD